MEYHVTVYQPCHGTSGTACLYQLDESYTPPKPHHLPTTQNDQNERCRCRMEPCHQIHLRQLIPPSSHFLPRIETQLNDLQHASEPHDDLRIHSNVRSESFGEGVWYPTSSERCARRLRLPDFWICVHPTIHTTRLTTPFPPPRSLHERTRGVLVAPSILFMRPENVFVEFQVRRYLHPEITQTSH